MLRNPHCLHAAGPKIRFLRGLPVALLLAAIVLVAAQTSQEDEPMYLAQEMAQSRVDSRMAKILTWIESGGNPNVIIDSNGNALVHSAATNRMPILVAAVSAGGDCNRRNNHGATPLHFAASQSQTGPGTDAIRILVRCIANSRVQQTCAGEGQAVRNCGLARHRR